MTESIRRQLVVPPYVSAIHMAVGFGMLAAGIALIAASPGSSVPAVTPAVELAEITPPVPAPAPRAAVAASEAPAPLADEIKLVLRAGGASYLQLAAVERDDAGALQWPAHGPAGLVKDELVHAAIAVVRDADVPALHRAWAGKQVVVDGTCRATVTGFAVVSRLFGHTPYAGLDKEDWDAASVMQLGTQVLAARLDGCSGTFARDAALAPVVVPEQLRDERLARVARSALMASSAATQVARDWDEYQERGFGGTWWEQTDFATKVLRHPRTGATFVAVHAHQDFACGSPDVNLWGLYRVAADGTLAPLHETVLGELRAVDQIVDVEGDGELELIGRPWLGNGTLLTDAGGDPLDRLEVQFYGCPC